MQASFTKKKPQNNNRIGEYQEQGVPQLVSILDQKGADLVVLNSQNVEITLASNRVFQLPGKIPPQFSHRNQIVVYLKELAKESNKIKNNVKLDKAWETFKNSSKEVTLEQIQKQIFPNQNLANYLAVRWALLSDRFYFKRGKNGFSPRPGESIESIKLAIAAEEERLEKIKLWANSILSGQINEEAISVIEQVAANGKKYERWEEVEELFEILKSNNFAVVDKKIEDMAFDTLVSLGIFSKHENLTPIKIGRATSFEQRELEAASQLSQINEESETLDHYIFTIDGKDTRDFDDALSFRKNEDSNTIGIHIADVSSFIHPGDILWETSLKRAATVYTSDQTYPMLPHVVSEGFLSLIKNELRKVISIEINFNKDYILKDFKISKNIIRVNERISYEELDESFKQNSAREELNLLKAIAEKLESERISKGAKVLPKREMQPTIDEQGIVKLELLDEETAARKLVGEMMILANSCMAQFAKYNQIPFIYRSQAAPENVIEESKFPEGAAREYALRGSMKRSELSCTPSIHSGLALECYCQSTSPIRRSVDLINQYQINQFLQAKETLSTEELDKILPELDSKLGEVTYLQRKRHRYWILTFIEQSGIKDFNATVVKCDGPKPLVEIDGLFLITQYNPLKNKSVQLGDRIKLKLEQISARLDRLKMNEQN